MRKVFTGNGPIPPHLMNRVERARLKAELCEGCALLTGNFSKLFRQLEKMEMEMSSYLKLIHGKLETRTVMIDSGDCLNDELLAKLEISEALRKDAVDKCSRKLANLLPRSKLEKLTMKQVNREMMIREVKVEPRNADTTNNQSRRLTRQYYEPNFEDYEDEDTGPVSVPAPEEEEGSGYLPEANAPIHSTIFGGPDDDMGMVTVKQEVVDESPVPVQIKLEQKEAAPEHHHKTSRAPKPERVQKKKADSLSQTIPPPIKKMKGVGMDENPDIIKDSKTGKYNCSICSKEYAREIGLKHHYKSAHLKVRFTCGLCRKDFPFKQNYERHYLNVHLGVRFQCGECNKTFSNKANLDVHTKSAHLGFRCRFCSKITTTSFQMKSHLKKGCVSK